MDLIERLIVGAGLTGLWIGQQLTQQKKSCQLIDKSKSVGGRMATRRWNEQKFDHGAQFYKVKTESQNFHQALVDKKLVRTLDDSKWVATNGISSLAKQLAKPLQIQFEKTVDQVFPESGRYKVHTLEGDVLNCKTLILTCPLPQTLKILDKSNIIYPSRLLSIQYSKAIVFLLSSKDRIPFPYPSPYVEPADGFVFSVSDQNWKTGLQGTAWTATMNPKWSDAYFEKTEAEQLEAFKNEFLFFHSSLEVQIKKWRYSHPTQQDPELASQPKGYPNLILAGDAFGGGSLNGAIRSAENTLKLVD